MHQKVYGFDRFHYRGVRTNILRKAEKYAIRNGGNDQLCHHRLLALYNTIKKMGSADSNECLSLEKTVLGIASMYDKSHNFRTTLENAAPNLFVFLQCPGMPPHNNAAELEIRDGIVLQRNVRHHLPTPEGRQVFSALISVGNDSGPLIITMNWSWLGACVVRRLGVRSFGTRYHVLHIARRVLAKSDQRAGTTRAVCLYVIMPSYICF